MRKGIYLLLLVTVAITVLSSMAFAENGLQGQWEINGDSTSGFPSMLILNNGGNASYDGFLGLGRMMNLNYASPF